ncbi:MAG: UDP-glucose 6-dehydrogenase, partial [Bdellovibrionaceae bacterium]|nr:UDP-glucose 6-dehydrogenase [Pseudobdellovibrionaceae bacterium]
MKVTVFGAGYVGLVTGACLSELGHSVTCVDIDQSKVDSLTKGQIPIYEPGLSDIVLRSVEAERLLFTTNAADAIDRSEILMVAVGTPQDKDGQADLQYVLKVAEQIGDQMKDYKLVVVKSTVPVGTCEKVRKTIQARLDARGLNVEFDIASNPEFLKEGSAVSDFQRPDRIVIGTNSEKATQMLSRLYRHFVQNGYRLVSMDVVSSELTKYASNAMLATKISFMNELSRMSEEVGADINAIRQGMGSDQRIGYHFIYAGLGYGGSCFPKDVKALIGTGRSMDIEMPLLSAVDEVNQRQRQYFIKNFLAYFDNDLAGKKVTLWGLSFKPNTDDVRE